MKNEIETWEDVKNYVIALKKENDYLKQQLHQAISCINALDETKIEEVNKDVRAMGEEKKGRR